MSLAYELSIFAIVSGAIEHELSQLEGGIVVPDGAGVEYANPETV